MSDQPQTPRTCDVLVIGGGPGGSTISALLAQKGWHVVVLEKVHRPCFHIGESLLPMNLPLLEQLGILEEVHRIGVIKNGAEFNAAEADEPVTFYFSQALDKNHPYAYEVRRSEFDHILLKNSAAKGAQVLEGVTVTDVAFLKGQTSLVTAETKDGAKQCWETRFVVDASGRDTFMANRLHIKQRNPKHNSAAVFGHYHGVERRSGQDEGNISVYWLDQGWLWMIPLRDDVMSIGAVCWPEYLKTRRCELEEFLWNTIQQCPQAAKRLHGARLISPVTATGNFSYQASSMAGEGYIMIGDAFAFVDPVFSSGVFLAMSGGRLGAEVVDVSLKNPVAAVREAKEFERVMRRGLGAFCWFIYRFTSPTMRRLFMRPGNPLRAGEAVISMLAGDIFRDTIMFSRLRYFKAIYYIIALTRLQQNVAAYFLRKRSVNVVREDPGE